MRQLEYEHSVEIHFLESFLPGADFENEIYHNIQIADLILVMASVDYLNERRDELLQIEQSNCFKKNRVVPVPVERCFWEGTFLGRLKPLPYDSDSKTPPFDYGNRWHEVFQGVQRMLKGENFFKQKERVVQRVRANSKTFGHSEDFDLNLSPSLFLNLRPGEIEFYVEGESMLPTYSEGATLIGRPVNLFEVSIGIIQPYIIKFKSRDPVLKFVRDIDNEKVTLASSHPDHPDFDMLLDDVNGIFLPVIPDLRRSR